MAWYDSIVQTVNRASQAIQDTSRAIVSNLRAIPRWAWRYRKPIAISTARLLSSVGSAIYAAPKIYKFILEEKTHEKVDESSLMFDSKLMYASIVIMSANFILNMGTRVPAIFKRFGPNAETLKLPRKWILDRHTTYTILVPDEQGNPIEVSREFGLTGTVAYNTLLFLNRLSMFFAFINWLQGGMTLTDFIAIHGFKEDLSHDDGELHKRITKELIAVGPGLILAIGNLLSYSAYNLIKSDENAEKIVISLLRKKIPAKKYIIQTTLISAFGLASTPFAGYFGTQSALKKLRLLKNQETLTKSLACGSAVTNTINVCLTSVPAVFNFLTHHRTPQIHTQPKPHWLKAAPLVYAAGTIDTFSIMMTAMVATVSTRDEIKILRSKYRAEILTTSAICAISNGVLTYLFGVHEGWQLTKRYYYPPDQQTAVIQQIEAGEHEPRERQHLITHVTGYGSFFDSSPIQDRTASLIPLPETNIQGEESAAELAAISLDNANL